MTLVTVLVPTHRHAETLPHAIRSALAQRGVDVEVFIVGDGVDEATRAAAEAAVREDARVRFFDRPKGERHGELSRHAALAEARGEVIAYLSDDDLFYPDHLAITCALLADADFVHPLAIFLDSEGAVYSEVGTPLDLGFRSKMCSEKRNVIPLTGTAHTRAFYEALPHGWRTSPTDVWTDLHMWRQILEVPGVRVAMPDRPTVIVMPSPERTSHTDADRGAEIAARFRLLEDEAERTRLERALIHAAYRRASQIEWDLTLRFRETSATVELFSARIAELEASLRSARDEAHRTQDVLRHEVRVVAEERDALAARLAAIEDSVTFRARHELLRIRGIRPVLLSIARAVKHRRP